MVKGLERYPLEKFESRSSWMCCVGFGFASAAVSFYDSETETEAQAH